MTCEQVFDALHQEQWCELARFLGIGLDALMKMDCHDSLTVVARKLDYMAARGIQPANIQRVLC